METTKNDLSQFEQVFFQKLSEYLSEPIYFYGSIQRADYFPQLCDIDIDIFSHNEKDIVLKLQNYLNLERSDIKQFVYKIDKTNVLVSGYKTIYKDNKNKLIVEIAVFNEKFKDVILTEHKSKFNMPDYIIYILIILKILHYYCSILPVFYYSMLKKVLTNTLFDGNKSEFVVVELDKRTL
jgi:hypothetical protein